MDSKPELLNHQSTQNIDRQIDRPDIFVYIYVHIICSTLYFGNNNKKKKETARNMMKVKCPFQI